MMLRRVNKEDYRYSLFLAALLHVGLVLALFLTLHHSTKRLLLAPPPLQVIHATAIPMDSFAQKTTQQTEKIKPLPTAAQTLSKSAFLEKSPVRLPCKEKKAHQADQDHLTPLRVPSQQASLTKKIVVTKTKITQPLKTVKKPQLHHIAPSKASLKLVEKNVQELLDQEMKSLTKQQINTMRNATTTDKYQHLILQAIAQQWIIPPEMNKHLETKLAVHLAPGGMVLEVIIVKSSGNPVLDRSAQTAVYKASPLPVPKSSDLFHTFRQINLTVRPEGVIRQ